MCLHPAIDEMAARLRPLPLAAVAGTGRPAAVMVPLFCQEGQWRVLFIRRSRHVAVHQGQIAFPGGCWESSDPDYLATARRELEEEVGIVGQEVHVLGGLTPCATATTRFLIHPFVGVLPPAWTSRPVPAEVDEVLTWPLERFLNGGEGEPVTFPVSDHEVIWGATARILHEFATLLQPVWKP